MTAIKQFDVLIVGAGLSGIGAACHIQRRCPLRSFAILEGREALGGTWDLFRYPGIRSDSDMHTLGYSFKPWQADQAIADGPSILAYLQETTTENDIERHIRFRQQVTRAEWSTETSTWTLTVTQTDTGDTTYYSCNFLFMCSGYYSYKGGYTPEFAGLENFDGPIVKPQQWPADLNYRDKRVLVIGSGATAMTLVPAMAKQAQHVTMLQRSPTYVVSRPDRDALANMLRRLLPCELAYKITRWKNVWLQEFTYKKSRTNPAMVKKQLLGWVRKALGPDYDVETHFTPSYNPWEQRLCLIPNDDLFEALRSGKASVITDQIETFTEQGIKLTSGDELYADIIVAATGLQLVLLGEVDFMVDGKAVDFANTWTYKGLCYSNVPNLASSFGYINASWTLRADLSCEYVCRLLNHMSKTGSIQCTPRLRPEDHNMPARPWIQDFSSGYMQRMMPMLPRQGDRAPWLNSQSYSEDKQLFRKAPIDDGVMEFKDFSTPSR